MQLARAGSKKLEIKYERQISALKYKAQDLKARVPDQLEMNDSAKAKFYSNWYFSGVRLLTSIEGFHNIDSIAEHLRLPKSRVREVVDFLLQYGLCIKSDGQIKMGIQRTHLDAKSTLVANHHRSWRLKAIESFDSLAENELFFTGPMTTSYETMIDIRKELTARVTKTVEPSKSEVLACINLDLFRVRTK